LFAKNLFVIQDRLIGENICTEAFSLAWRSQDERSERDLRRQREVLALETIDSSFQLIFKDLSSQVYDKRFT